MRIFRRALSCLTVFAVVLGLLPTVSPHAAAAAGDGISAMAAGGFSITQSAEWDKNSADKTLANVKLEVSSNLELQKPKDVVFVIDHGALEALDIWKDEAKTIARTLSSVPGTRYALVSFSSSAETKLDFTTSVSQFSAAVDTIERWKNSNPYAAFLAAKQLIDNRGDKSQKACIVLIGHGRFNINFLKAKQLTREIKNSVPIYGLYYKGNGEEVDTSMVSQLCSVVNTDGGIAAAIGESKIYDYLTVTAQLDTGKFKPISGGTAADGTITFRIPNYQMGQLLKLSFSGVLLNRSEIGTIHTAGTATVALIGELKAAAPGVSLSRSGLYVTYDANGANSGTAPVDHTPYVANDEVIVRSANLQKEGWHFSGWAHPNLNLGTSEGESFNITGDTTLKASWGRAYVKLSTSTIGTEIHGTHMLSRNEIISKYKDENGNDTSFYNASYWSNIQTITLHDFVDIPEDRVAQWDITNTRTGDDEYAVMAWIVQNTGDGRKYNLHIGGRGGLTAPQSCYRLFWACPFSEINGLEYLDTSNTTDMNDMFYHCFNVQALNIANWDVSNVESMRFMFYNCMQLSSLKIFKLTDSRVLLMESMFSNCWNLQSLDVADWNVSNVTDMSNMFLSCQRLSFLNVADWNVSNVTNMKGMFNECFKLPSLDVSGWDVSKVRNMENMFSDCLQLQFTPSNLSGWDVSNVTNMHSMFANCHDLSSLDLANWNMQKVNDISLMFYGCSKLTGLNTEKLTVAINCHIDSWREGADSLPQEIGIFDTDDKPLGEVSGSASGTAASLYEESDVREDEFFTEDDLNLPEDEVFSSDILNEPKALAVDPDALDEHRRPVFANKKIGIWDCGEVTTEQRIEYSLELQYLNDENSSGGASGILEVTNQIPEDLTYNGDAAISGVQRIESGDLGDTKGTVVKAVSVDANNVLTFTVDGLSAGAKYVVTYSCTTPAAAPAAYTEFLNRAYVNDRGLNDQADPVLHYMNRKPSNMLQVRYKYASPFPTGENPPPSQSCPPNTQISLPVPSAPGWEFLGWNTMGNPGDAYIDINNPYTIDNPTTFTGFWHESPELNVKIDYSFDSDSERPPDADAILNMMLENWPVEFPANYTAGAPKPFIPDGYAFEWIYPEKLTVTENDRFNVLTPDDWENQTIPIKGKWTRIPYPVQYQYDGNAPADASPLPASEHHAWDEPVEAADNPPDTATHIFMGWIADGDDITFDSDGRFIMPKRPVTFTGNWVPRPVTPTPIREVKINPNGGTWNGTDAESVLPREEYDQGIEKPLKTNADFIGWDEDPTDPDFELVVTARWEERTPSFTVTFDARGGTPVPDTQTVADGGTATAPVTAPARTGCSFTGWFTEPACQNKWNFDTPVTADLTLYAGWDPLSSTSFTVAFDARGGAPVPDTQTVADGGTAARPGSLPVRAGYRFTGWFTEPACQNEWDFSTPVTADLTLYAGWDPLPAVSYTITASARGGGSISPAGKISVAANGDASFSIRPDDGYEVEQILVDGVNISADGDYTFRNVSADHSIEVIFRPVISSPRRARPAPPEERPAPQTHGAYLYGCGDGLFRPDDGITRGQTAQLFFNLLEDQTAAPASAFSDVPDSLWCARAVCAVDALGIMDGTGGGHFSPDAEITRAEFIAAAMRFLKKPAAADCPFSDVSLGDWFYPYVSGAAALGWIGGYPDGSFRPHSSISRAEVTVVMNRVLGRAADTPFIDLHRSGLPRFPDVAPDHWAFYEIMESVTPHSFYINGNSENWERLLSQPLLFFRRAYRAHRKALTAYRICAPSLKKPIKLQNAVFHMINRHSAPQHVIFGNENNKGTASRDACIS